MTKRYLILGINADSSVCDVCGKTGLSRVVWLEDRESCQIFAAGTTCSAKLRCVPVADQRREEKRWLELHAKQLRESIRKEMSSCAELARKVVCTAPSRAGNAEVTFKDRLEYIRNHPDTVAYNHKRLEVAQKYGLTINQVESFLR